jgi:hypothetical protein
MVSHDGGTPGFSAFYGRLPAEETAVVLLSNRADLNCTRLAHQILDEVGAAG